ncbi:MAG: 16S rRNA (uracil(1498)-N(3))-methyltransferase [Bacteroidales bacterium]
MHIFYTPEILTTLELSEEESQHCNRVLRMVEGDEVMVTDGDGHFYRSVITRAHHKRTSVEIVETINEEISRPYKIHIAVAPTKSIDRIEWFLEKAVEIGVDEISLLRCRYSERKDVKEDRLRKIMISAMKQSLKSRLPILNPMVDIKQFLQREQEGQKFIAHCYKDQERIYLQNAYMRGDSATILIGPEGDFSEAEVELALESGYKPISLGSSRLRTETAALVACHSMHAMNW